MKRRSRFSLPEFFDRDLKLLTVSMSARRISMGSLEVVRAIYFALLGFSPVEIGLLLSIGTLVSAIHHLSFGMLSDKFGRKIFLVLGGIFATARMIIFAVSTDFWVLALGQGIGAMGEGAGAGQPVVSGYIADKVGIRDRPAVFSTLSITNALAATLGSLMASLPAYFKWTLGVNVVTAHAYLFWIGALGAGASIVTVLLISEVRPSRVERVKGGDESRDRRGSWGVIAKFSLVRGTSGLGFGLIDSLMSLYFYERFGVGGEFLGPVFAAARFLSIFTYMLVPALVDRFGEIQSLVASRILTAGVVIAFSLAGSLSVSVVLLIIQRVLSMFTMPIRQTLAVSIVDPEETATAIGVSSFARMGIRTVAPTVAGYMFEAVSYTMPFFMGSVLVLINGLLYRAFFMKPRKSQPDDS